MCGRFTLTLEPAELQQSFPEVIFPQETRPRYNIAPGQPILALKNEGQPNATFLVWGLVPSWAKDPALGNRLINARAETLAEKPSFRNAFKYRRCLIYADGFFEWQMVPASKQKVPHFIHLKSGQPFTLAGLWERWISPDGSELLSATIITTTPNPLIQPIHERMPVILSPENRSIWLDPLPRFPVDLNSLLVPYPADEMELRPISPMVNDPKVDSPAIVQAS